MSTINLAVASTELHEEFVKLRAARREHEIPFDMINAFELLELALSSPEIDNPVDVQSKIFEIVSLANNEFLNLRAIAMAAEALLGKSDHGNSDNDVVAARSVLYLLAAKAGTLAEEIDIAGMTAIGRPPMEKGQRHG